MSLEKPSARAVLLPGVLLFIALAWHLNFLCDDAFISFRYSHNLVEGHGLRYNLTNEIPVEGYSNFLWVLWLAPFEWLGANLGLVARLTSVVAGAVLCVWVPLHARKRFALGTAGTLCTSLFFASLPCTALWATGGLATMPTALLLFGVYERLLGDPERPRGMQAGAFAAASGLIRADGAVWVALIFGAAMLLWLLEGRQANLLRALGIAATWLVLCVGAHVAWRYSYYGDYLPNTARVKAGLSSARLERGANYVATWFLSLPGLLVVVASSLRRWPRALWSPVLASAVVIAGALSYAVLVGGDFMPFGRFLFSATPFVALLFAGVWRSYGERKWIASSLALCAIGLNLFACFASFPGQRLFERFHFRLNGPWKSELEQRASMIERTREWSALGRALALFTGPEDSMPLRGIGAIGYYSRVQIFDCHGLVSPEVIPFSPEKSQASPGHDIEVPSTFFYKRKPTFGGCFLAPRTAPLDFQLPPNWDQHPASKMMRLERHPLPPGQGFEPESELRLLRFVSWP